jgi:hypothetical protein
VPAHFPFRFPEMLSPPEIFLYRLEQLECHRTSEQNLCDLLAVIEPLMGKYCIE